MALLVGFLAWRMTHEGPIHMRFLVPYMEEAINGPDQDLQISIDDAVLTWAGWQRALDVRGVNLHVRDRHGRDLATIPQASVALSARALMRGMIAPSRIEIFGASLRLWRSRDNRLMFGPRELGGGTGNSIDTADQDSDKQAEILARVLGEMLQPPDPHKQTGYLSEVAIIDGQIELIDRYEKTSWRAEKVQVDVTRDTDGLDGTISFQSPDLGNPASLSGHLTLRNDTRELEIDTQVTNLEASRLGLLQHGLNVLADTDLRLNGRLKTEFGLDGKIGAANFEMSSGAGVVSLQDHTKKPIPLQSLLLSGSLDPDRDVITIYDLTADVSGPILHLTGSIEGLMSGKAADGGALKLQFNLHGSKIDAALMDGYWPNGMAENTRSWLVPNIPSGMVDELQADVLVQLPASPDEKPLVKVNGTMQTSGLTVHYLRPLPPITDGVATATFTEKQFAADIKSGGVGKIKLTGGKLLISGLDQEDQNISIGGDIVSPLADALTLLDNPRLGYPTKLGLKPANSSGDAKTHIQFDFPAKKNLTFANVKLGVQAMLDNVGLKQVMFGRDVSEGMLSLDLNQDGMTIKGGMKLAGIPLDATWIENFTDNGPFNQQIHAVGVVTAEQSAALGYDYRSMLNGSSKLDLTFTRFADHRGQLDGILDLKDTTVNLDFLKWRKAAGTPGTAKMRLDLQGDKVIAISSMDIAAGDLSATGNLKFKPDGSIDKLTLTKAAYGRTNVDNVEVGFVGDRIDVVIGDGNLDAEPYYTASAQAPPKDQATLDLEAKTPQRPFTVKAAHLATARIAEGRELKDVAIELSHDPFWWNVIDVRATLPGGAPMTVVYRPAGDGTHQLTAQTKDGGAALRVLNLYDSIKGGELSITGTVKDNEPNRPMRGKLDMTSYRLIGTPFFIRFLTVASLTGLVDVLSGEGFFFDGASSKFTKTRGVIDVKKFRSAGPSIGLTATGRIDLDRSQIDIKGTMVPAYAFNSILGNIPVIGNILQGGAGEGIFAATYAIGGGLSEPKINVNPWSALAPGFMRNLFTDDGTESDGKTAPAVPFTPRNEKSH
ncbi:MAG: AsmA-like C-terminal domain-containing protein [Dongiaceae bacterium]